MSPSCQWPGRAAMGGGKVPPEGGSVRPSERPLLLGSPPVLTVGGPLSTSPSTSGSCLCLDAEILPDLKVCSSNQAQACIHPLTLP